MQDRAKGLRAEIPGCGQAGGEGCLRDPRRPDQLQTRRRRRATSARTAGCRERTRRQRSRPRRRGEPVEDDVGVAGVAIGILAGRGARKDVLPCSPSSTSTTAPTRNRTFGASLAGRKTSSALNSVATRVAHAVCALARLENSRATRASSPFSAGVAPSRAISAAT